MNNRLEETYNFRSEITKEIIDKQKEKNKKIEEENIKKKNFNNSLYIPGLLTNINNLYNSTTPQLTTEQMRAYYSGLIATCVDIRSEEVQKAKYILYYKTNQTKDNEVINHPFVEILRNAPNPIMSWTHIWNYISASLDTYGNAYLYTQQGNLKKPIKGGIYVLPADEMQIIEVKNVDGIDIPTMYRRTSYNNLSNKSFTVDFPATQIIHFKNGFNPYNYLYGMSIMQKASLQIAILNEEGKYQYHLLRNDGVPPRGFLEQKENDGFSNDDFNAVQEDYSKTAYGAINNGTIQKLPAGYTYKSISINPAELDFVQSVGMSERHVCMMYRVPPSALGTGDSTNKSTAGINIQNFYHTVIRPICSNICDTLNIYLSNVYSKDNIYLNYELELPNDPEQNRKNADTMSNMATKVIDNKGNTNPYVLQTLNDFRNLLKYNDLK